VISVAVVGSLLLLAGILLSALMGQLPVSVPDVVGTILASVGFDNPWTPDDQVVRSALQIVRFPRILMAVAVGAALAVAGAVMQAIFGNPLAEPGVVGVSAGAALGAATGIVTGAALFGDGAIALFAFVGGLLATFLVYFVARSGGRTEVVTLLLTGIAVNAFAGAGLAFLLFMADSASREQIIFWQLGSLGGSLWPEALLVLIVMVLGTIAALLLARRYDLLALGDRNARHLGVDVERLRIISIVLVAVLTAVGVAFVGIISFVGLIVPHLVRMLVGPGHRPLLALSALGGAVLLVLADLLARTLISGAELPIGLLTSLVGGPFFFLLLWRQRRRAGGWA